MQHARLGRTALQVSRLCLGTMNFGPETSEEDSFALMDRALEAGVDFFDTAKFTEASFVSTSIAKKDDAFEVTGNLSLHGVTKGITFPAKITLGADEVSVAADFAINRKDFGIVYAGKPDNLIADNVALKLDLHARKKAPVPTPAQ